MGDAAGPIRMCVGCRVRDVASALLRVVVDDGGGLRVVTAGQRGRCPGRGASLHPVLECLELAERRRAFARSFRRPGPFDTSNVRSWIERRTSPEGAAAPKAAEIGKAADIGKAAAEQSFSTEQQSTRLRSRKQVEQR